MFNITLTFTYLVTLFFSHAGLSNVVLIQRFPTLLNACAF